MALNGAASSCACGTLQSADDQLMLLLQLQKLQEMEKVRQLRHLREMQLQLQLAELQQVQALAHTQKTQQSWEQTMPRSAPVAELNGSDEMPVVPPTTQVPRAVQTGRCGRFGMPEAGSQPVSKQPSAVFAPPPGLDAPELEPVSPLAAPPGLVIRSPKTGQQARTGISEGAALRRRTLVVAKLPRCLTDAALVQALATIVGPEKVVHCRILREPCGRSKCYAFVEFVDEATAHRAEKACGNKELILLDQSGVQHVISASRAKRATAAPSKKQAPQSAALNDSQVGGLTCTIRL